MIQEHSIIFTGSAILVNRLRFLLDQAKIPSLIKDNVESARLGGYGTFQNTIELFIFNSDLQKATSIIEEFKKEIAE
jgi:hypothetical protein